MRRAEAVIQSTSTSSSATVPPQHENGILHASRRLFTIVVASFGFRHFRRRRQHQHGEEQERSKIHLQLVVFLVVVLVVVVVEE